MTEPEVVAKLKQRVADVEASNAEANRQLELAGKEASRLGEVIADLRRDVEALRTEAAELRDQLGVARTRADKAERERDAARTSKRPRALDQALNEGDGTYKP